MAVVEQPQENKQVQQVSTLAKRLCDDCGKPTSSSCGRCKLVSYCKPECQKNAWKTHRYICVPTGQPENYTKPDQRGLTPLHYAVLYGKEGSLLPAQQAQLNVVKDAFNGTPADLKG